MTATDIWLLLAAALLVAAAGMLSAADAAINRVSRVSVDAYERQGRRGVDAFGQCLAIRPDTSTLRCSFGRWPA